jgi:hypothetical protein
LDEASNTTPSIEETSAIADGRRWPASMAFLTTWCLPATTAKRTAHVSLIWAYVVHVVALLAAALLIILFVAIAETADLLNVWDSYGALTEALGQIASEVARYSREAVLDVLIGVACIELGFLAVALVITPWGARDEPIQSSLANGLRRTWLHTTHGLAVVLLIGLPATELSRMETRWQVVYRAVHPQPEWPRALENAPQGSQALQEYRKAQQEYWTQSGRWLAAMESTQPWYFRHLEVMVTYASILAGVWVLWALLRAVGAPRKAPQIDRPPTCEACGYNLTTIPLESRCPECGEPVILSLGPDSRPGAIWERRRVVGRLAAWWRCCVDPFSPPRDFARKLQVVAPSTDHRRFLVMHLPVVFVLSFLGAVVLFLISTGVAPLRAEPFVIFVVCPVLAIFSTLGALGLTLLAAGLVGLWFYILDRRNLLAGSMQIACYLGGCLTLWIAFAWVTGAVVMVMNEAKLFRVMEDAMGILGAFLAFLAWFVPNLVCVVAYFGLVARGTAGLRYANK